MLFKLDTKYISPEDKFLNQVSQKVKLSASQLKEIAKHERIARLRDDADAPRDKLPIWEKF